jgi:hypothetical protein
MAVYDLNESYNAIMNRLFVGSRRKKVLEYLLNEKGEVDFNNVIRMPHFRERPNVGILRWALNNWGTRENALNSMVYGSNIYFTTAEAPKKLIKELSVKFPDVEFKLTWVDDLDYRFGSYCFKGGKITKVNAPKTKLVRRLLCKKLFTIFLM